uniref:Putative secreted peptide n=1 Tax=Anopheles braziliensis TaxID=58242 RepID=A0A2M3ZRI6_9DIPT
MLACSSVLMRLKLFILSCLLWGVQAVRERDRKNRLYRRSRHRSNPNRKASHNVKTMLHEHTSQVICLAIGRPKDAVPKDLRGGKKETKTH